MAEVAIGVPVYNGAAMLEECLECLRAQTFRDIAVVVFDNASTDGSAAIAAAFAARDPRFRLVRQPENKGAIRNFIDALEAAEAPFFLWRAHDDLSSADYVERLHEALVRHPAAQLAVGTVATANLDGSKARRRAPPAGGGRGLARTAELLFASHASWFYGVWRREALRASFLTVMRDYPYGWASDHLTLYPFLIADQVVGVAEARFIQRIKRTAGPRRRAPPIAAAEMARLRRGFLAYCGRVIAARDDPPWRRAALRALTWLYVGKRVYRWRRMARRQLAERLRRR